MDDQKELSAIDTLAYTFSSLGGTFRLMNAWADPDRAFMNDHARYDANMILSEVYARLAHVYTRIEATLQAPENSPGITILKERIAALEAEVKAAEDKLAHLQHQTPVPVKAGKREVTL